MIPRYKKALTAFDFVKKREDPTVRQEIEEAMRTHSCSLCSGGSASSRMDRDRSTVQEVRVDDVFYTQAIINSLVADEHVRPPREQMDARIVAAPAGQLEPNILPLLAEDVSLIEAAPAGWLEPNITPQHGLEVPQMDKVVDVDDLLFSQPGCNSHFQHCGRSLQTLIDALDRWEIDPMTADFLKLKAVECNFHGHMRIHSLDNRRLYCLKVHQENQRAAGWRVRVTVRCSRVVREVVGRFDLLNGGRTIRIRN